MKSDIFTFYSFQDGLQSLSDSGRVSSGILPDRRGEHPPEIDRFLYSFSTFKTGAGSMTLRMPALVLSGEVTSFSLTRWTCRPHSKFPGAEVEVIPLQGANFAAAQAGGEFQQKQLITIVLLGLD